MIGRGHDKTSESKRVATQANLLYISTLHVSLINRVPLIVTVSGFIKIQSCLGDCALCFSTALAKAYVA